MKIFNRNIKDVALSGPAYLWYFLKCLFIFKHPLRFIYSYLTFKPVPNQVVELRSGLKIYLSEFGHDVITVFVIFVRKDYGAFAEHKNIVDIGANIGVFSLYAAHVLKARHVYAYEPHPGSFACLQKNIRENNLQGRIDAYELAVSDVAGEHVELTIGAGPYNTIFHEDHPEMKSVYGTTKSVETTSMSDILLVTGKIDVLKLDCEGSEYDILFNASPAIFGQIGEIRMEYHRGRVEDLNRLLTSSGYWQTLSEPYTETVGNLWYERHLKTSGAA